MKLPAEIFKILIKRKLAIALLVTISVTAFATLGDGKKKGQKKGYSSGKFAYSAKNFNLRSNYNYKGINLLNTSKTEKFIMLNTTVSYQKGNATYIMPLKKKVILSKVKFNPAPEKY